MKWLLLLLLCSVGAQAAELPSGEEVRPVMGTMATVQVWSEDNGLARAALDSAFAVFVHVDSLMSTWNGNSPLSRLNRAPVTTWVEVGAEVCTVIEAACEVSRLTDGAFDPTVLPLVKLWGFRGGKMAVPDTAALAAARDLVDVAAVEVGAGRARLLRAGMALDLGGIAKGYALDQAAIKLASLGVTGAVLDLGGNLRVCGQGPGTEVGVVNPTHPDAWALTVPVDQGAVATSGQYERFVTIAGHDYGHILDPRTGWPVPGGISATVITETGLWADALATAATVLGGSAGEELLERLPGVEGVLITKDRVWATSGLVATEGK